MKKFLGTLFLISFVLLNNVSGGTSIFGFGSGLVGSFRYPYSVSALGRGGSEMGFIDSLSINQLNYALWTKLERTSISLNFRYIGIRTEFYDEHITSNDGKFMGGFITLPLMRKKLVLGVGLAPRLMSDIGIKITNVGPDERTVVKVQSKGNLSEATLVGSFSFISGLSFAVETGYDFGMITDKTAILFNRLAYSDIIIIDEYQMQGINYGLNCFYEISDKFNLGLKYKSTTDLTIHDERKSSNLPSSVKQTRTVSIPMLIAGGLTYKMGDLWQTGLDLVYQDWASSYRIDDQKVENVNDSYRLGLGFEKSPVERRFVPYIQEITWRGGMFFSRLNITSENNPVYEYGVTMGIGLPIRKNRSCINIAFEFGQRGSLESSNLKERFFGVALSLSSSEQWFVREKR